MRGLNLLLCLSFLVLHAINPVEARIKLVALPERQATQVQLENEQHTLLSEERELNLQAGSTEIDFSWQNVQILPDSIHLMVLEQQAPVRLLSVSYPPNAQALVWTISSPNAQTIRVRINYLLRHLDRLITYEAKANAKETQLELMGSLVLRNFSGEDLFNTQFQLAADQFVKTDLRNQETKRLQFLLKTAIPMQKRFVFDARVLPWEPELQEKNVGIPVFYELKNTAESQLGQMALWAGKTRLYGTDSQGGKVFLGEDRAAFTPVGDTLSLQIGESRDVVVTQRVLSEKRLNERRNHKNQVVLYDVEETMQVTLENFRDESVLMTLKQGMDSEWEMMKTSHPFVQKSFDLIEFELNLPAREKVVVDYTYQRRHQN
ncbi:hypothetical protein [Thioflexithrix psekupsensis]|uniref:DUF4139 domain-containing protein n=1 Tax=Thioflexithrix psekupsensis TaxID=1570016 RepID=A0A251X5W9_9GAMM|nr:hypothetical protein [Thioflexithrix psekupsensis]OUD12542.1 hypothetical protein TPSD3_15760 [Thioflexithrix psekupsensis]